MRQIRAACQQPEQDNAVPNEIIYADDTVVVLNDIESKASDILQTWNLTMNMEKTEPTTLKRETNREEEKWRKITSLASYLVTPKRCDGENNLQRFH